MIRPTPIPAAGQMVTDKVGLTMYLWARIQQVVNTSAATRLMAVHFNND